MSISVRSPEAACAAGAAVYGPVPQGPFLRAMGIDLRIARLLERATPDQRRELRAALFRLTDGGAMGELFKVLALAGPDAPPPPGFGAPTLSPATLPDEPMIEASNLAALDDLRHGFFTREGGVSEGAFASLNCGLSSGDEAARVAENRARALRRLDMPGDSLRTVRQVHGARVLVVRDADGAQVEADALVTDRLGVTLGVVCADCAPVLIADREARVIGCAHAGWRGALAGVIEATVEAMARLGGAARGDARRRRPLHRAALLRGRARDARPVRRGGSGQRGAVRAGRGLRPPAVRSQGLCAAPPRRGRRRRPHWRCPTTPWPTRRASSARGARARAAAPLRPAPLGHRAGRLAKDVPAQDGHWVEGIGSLKVWATVVVALAAWMPQEQPN